MKMNTLSNVKTQEAKMSSRNSRVKSTIILKNNQIGVSTNSAHMSNTSFENYEDGKFWFAMRTTYGRERKAYEYVVSQGGTAYYPVKIKECVENNVRKVKQVSLLPNIIFIYGTEEEVKEFAYDNVHLSFLRFYYSRYTDGLKICKKPLIVPNSQMISFQILCDSSSDTILVPDTISKFSQGQKVRIVEGEFAGIEGRVARWHGQQRVAVIIDGLCTMATAYVPSSFLKLMD